MSRIERLERGGDDGIHIRARPARRAARVPGADRPTEARHARAATALDVLAGLDAAVLPGHGPAWRGSPAEAVARARS